MRTLFVPLLSVHIECSISTLSPMLAGKLELLEIAVATASLRKSMKVENFPLEQYIYTLMNCELLYL